MQAQKLGKFSGPPKKFRCKKRNDSPTNNGMEKEKSGKIWKIMKTLIGRPEISDQNISKVSRT